MSGEESGVTDGEQPTSVRPADEVGASSSLSSLDMFPDFFPRVNVPVENSPPAIENQSTSVDVSTQTMFAFGPFKNIAMGAHHHKNKAIWQERKKLYRQTFSGTTQFCPLCYKNGDLELYVTHNLKEKSGKIICPVLRAYVCEICGATGDYAHTRTYCPLYNRGSWRFYPF